MLKPFQIRDLYVSPPQRHEELSEPRPGILSGGVVQVSAADYDDLALNHPRARLTYVDDDDDGDTITVGSSFELSQRLDEPVHTTSRLESIQLSHDDPAPMHLFDIRRSNSVTELWKQFGRRTEAHNVHDGETSDAEVQPTSTVDNREHEEFPTAGDTAAASAPGDETQPLLAAFEAELADILNAAESSGNETSQPESVPGTEPSVGAGSQRNRHPIEIIAAQVLYHLVHGASLVQSELSSRMPELQRQLRNAQRSVPENVGTSLQALLTTLEAHARTTLNNLPDGGRQLAEEAVHAGRPVAENAADSFRTMASEFNEMGRTLFAAFENEFGRTESSRSDSTSEGLNNSTPGAFPHVGATNDAVAAGTVHPQGVEETHPTATEKETSPVDPGHSKAFEPGTSNEHCTPSDALDASRSTQAEGQPNVAPASSGPHHFPHHSPHSHPSPPPVPPMPSNSYAPPPFWQPFQHFNRPPQFNPRMHPPPPPYTERTRPFQWPPVPAYHWFNAPRHPTSHSPQNPNGISAASSASAPLRSGGTRTSPPPNKSLFIGNVGYNVTERMIQDVFASKGFIVDVDLPLDATSGRHAGFGYLHFPSIHPATAAMEALQGTHIDGHSINLEFSDHSPIESIRVSQTPAGRMDSSRHNAQQSSPQAGLNQSEQDATYQKPTPGPQRPAFSPGLKEHIPRQNRGGPSDHSKSVAFQDLSSSTRDAPSHSSKKKDASVDPRETQTESLALLDSPSDDPALTAHFPSLLSDKHSHPHASASREQLPSLSPELEMTRFPPVSQLEAQLLANKRHGHAAKSTPGASTNQAPKDQERSCERSSIRKVPSHPAPEFLPQRSRTVTNTQGTRNLGQFSDSPRTSYHGRQNCQGHAGYGLRRSNTMMFAHPEAKQSGPFDPPASDDSRAGTRLRRRATEHHSLRPSARRTPETDTWARLSRRERAGSSSYQRIPGSFPVEEASQTPAPSPPDNSYRDPNEGVIERCVSALVGMGYGTARDGGRSRMAVYAAAADGNLLDAIEMIEEERKAYGWHGLQ